MRLKTLEKLGNDLSLLNTDELNFVFDIIEKKRSILIDFKSIEIDIKL